MKRVYDRKTVHHTFKPGDQVMVLLLVLLSPFQVKSAGLYRVSSKEPNDNYVVATPDKEKVNATWSWQSD